MKFSWARVATWVVAAAIGFVYGIAGTIGQSARWGWFPVGLIVAIIGVAALVLAVRLLTADRWAALATGAGIALSTVLFSGTGPGGSVVVPAPPEGELSTGVIWMFAAPIVAGLIVAWPSTPAVRDASEDRPTN
ncbi:DUF6113 family protein [Microbacterium invictum]|uniref:Histidinol dehydrogenase n=1 Tax=Microbacterium invictum TaxID=515415 RepID=A0AA40SM67_9MICO|nr:DUF6113 family protein [Microbacterium invictum]MBB4138757.1 hypothetical protein [Microbacterium invictum]